MTVTPFSNLALATDQAAIIAVNCELVRGTEDQLMKELLPRVQQQSVVLDLSGVERMDAAGIATLITLYCSATEAGNDFSIVDPSCHVLELLRLVGLEDILVEEPEAASAKSGCGSRSTPGGRNTRYSRTAA